MMPLRKLQRFTILFGLLLVITLIMHFYLAGNSLRLKSLDGNPLYNKVENKNAPPGAEAPKGDPGDNFENNQNAQDLLAQDEDQDVDIPEDYSENEIDCKGSLKVQDTDIQMGTFYHNLPFENIDGGVWKQGFDISYSPHDWDNQALEVVVLPHSHQDPGWKMTLEEYFQKTTHKGLDATLDFLEKNPDLRFVYAEVVFLDKWWGNLPQSLRTLFIKFVRDGQWEIGTGGWVMNDEAVTHFGATVSQLIEGQHWMLDNIGVVPNVSWVIDAFGHSATEAYILRKAGIRHALIHRTHYEIKKALAQRRQLEFRWRQPWEKEEGLLTHLLPFFSYDVPHTCGPDPKICCQFDFLRQSLHCPWGVDPVAIGEDNIAERAELLVDQYRKKAKLFDNTGVVLVTLGDDFRFATSDEWNLQVSNYRLLMDYINAHAATFHMHVQFGTLSDYFRLVESRKPMAKFPTLSGDFYTYADKDKDFWNGYFTSRPDHKAMVRLVEAEVRSADLLFSLARHWSGVKADVEKLFVELFQQLTLARRHLALNQHHDAITGTSRMHVMKDFRSKLSLALSNAQNVSSVSLALLLSYESPDGVKALLTAPVMASANPRWPEHVSMPENAVINLEGVGDTKVLYLFNSLPRPRHHLFRLTVDLSKVLAMQEKAVSLKVTVEGDPNPLVVQLEPCTDFAMAGKDAASSSLSSSVGRFPLTAGPIQLAPLQALRVTLTVVAEESTNPGLVVTKPTLYRFAAIPFPLAAYLIKGELSTLSAQLESPLMLVNFDPATGFAQRLLNKKTGQTQRLEIAIETRRPNQAHAASGAYLGSSFPTGEPLSKDPPELRHIHGDLLEEVTAYYPIVAHTLRLRKSDSPGLMAIEVENMVNLTSIRQSFEVVMTLQTDVDNTDGVFYTDSNCYQVVGAFLLVGAEVPVFDWRDYLINIIDLLNMMRRQYSMKLREGGNVYPMSCAAYIEDARGRRVTLLAAQPLGVSAGERPGQLRVWLHRKTTADDERGLGEPMAEVLPARSLFRVVFERVATGTSGRGTAILPHLTSDAHSILTDLLNPAAQFVALGTPSTLAPSRALMSPSGLPCTLELVAMKTFFSKSERFKGLESVPGSQLGVVVRRITPGCGSTGFSEEECSPLEDFTINPRKVFPSLVPSRVVKTPLNLIPDKSVSTAVETEMTVEPMEMEAYLLVPEGAQFSAE